MRFDPTAVGLFSFKAKSSDCDFQSKIKKSEDFKIKKLSTTILHKGKEKAISVWLDDETARLLEECGDERLKHEYIVEEYKARLIERRETRRHQSLEKSMDSGFDMADENADIETEVFRTMDLDKLYQAVQQLEPQQKWLVVQIFYKGRTRVDVAKELRINESKVRSRLERIYKKIKKFLI